MYGDTIRRLRIRDHMSQQALGDALGVTAVAISKWERGQTQPNIENLKRLAEVFGVSVDEIVGHENRTVRAESDTGAQPNMCLMTRAFRQLTPDEQEKLLAVGRALFAHAFSPENS